MADIGIKKATVLNSDLPSIDSSIEGYSVRYRIISEDKNRTSHWSPTFLIQPDYTFVSNNISFSKNGSIAQQAWDAVSILKDENEIRKASEYDIWVKWDRSDGGDWIYLERIQGTSISFPIPETYTINGVIQVSQPNRLTTEIYLRGNPVSRDSDFLKVYTDGPHTI
jgi:hypothetical protein